MVIYLTNSFIYASFDEVKHAAVTDVYFLRTRRILEDDKLDRTEVYAELTISSMPEDYYWGILGGVRDVAKLLEGLKINVYSFPEGSVIYKRDYYGVKIPIMAIEGPYGEFIEYETPLLGFLATGSGIATKAARCKKAAGRDTPVISFGARRTHPAIAPFNAFYAYIGGCDGVSCVLGAEKFLGIKPTGTMPHSLIIIYTIVRGSQEEAWKAYDRVMPPDVPRIMLVDTYSDEVRETLRAVQAVGASKLWGVRLDTPSSRRGSFEDIIREVKWELKVRGYSNVKVFVSGGINEYSIPRLKAAGADGFGVGSAIANARIIDIAMDIVAVKKDGRWIPAAKRGKLSGVKKVYRCPKCLIDIVRLTGEEAPKCPKCGGEMDNMLKPLILDGKVVMEFPDPREEREYVLSQLDKLNLDSRPW